MSNRLGTLLVPLFAFSLFAQPAPVAADSGGVVRFATLPDGPGFPEGIAVDAGGGLYVSTFDFGAPNVIHVYSPTGQLERTMALPGGALPLGLAFDTAGDLYVADFGSGDVLRFSPDGAPVATYDVCDGQASGCALNAITFDAGGDLYVSDSFGGRVFRIDLPAGSVSTFLFDDRLMPGSHGFPPFGANGLAFDAAGAHLYIANTADDRIFKYELATQTLTSFAESVNGADGIAFDAQGRLWVAANQADEVVALDARGRVVARRGSFEGIAADGAPKGLLFPASIALSRGNLFVTNLALPLSGPIGDEPEEDVDTYTVSRIPLGGR